MNGENCVGEPGEVIGIHAFRNFAVDILVGVVYSFVAVDRVTQEVIPVVAERKRCLDHPRVLFDRVFGGKKPGTVRSVLQRKKYIQTSVISLWRTRMSQGIQIPSRVGGVTYARGDR